MTPSTPVTDAAFKYVGAAFTDVTKTFLKHGWIPPSQEVQYEKRRELNEVVYE